MKALRALYLLSLAAVFSFAGLSSRAATNVVTTLADGGPGSLREAIAQSVPGDVISIATNGTIILAGGELLLTNHVSILGAGPTNTILSGNSANRVFRIIGGVNVLLSGLNLTDAKTPEGTNAGFSSNAPSHGGSTLSGGAIFNEGSLTLHHCFINNNRTGNGGNGGSATQLSPTTGSGGNAGHGGAIYSTGPLILIDCSITNNAPGSGGYAGNGPTFYLGGGGSAGSGGAIYCAASLSMSNCLISGNRTHFGGRGGDNGLSYGSGGNGGSGGAIYGETLVALERCVFNRNSCGFGAPGGGRSGSPTGGGGHGGNGGAIYCATSIVNECTFSGNSGGFGGSSADGGTAGNGGSGGAIHTSGGGKIRGSTFSQNSAGGGGSAGAYALTGTAGSGGGIQNFGVLEVKDCTFNGNRSGSGGNIFFNGTGSQAGGDGAGIRNVGTLRATNCTFADNFTGLGGGLSLSPPVGSSGRGGGIYNSGVLTLISCTLAFNSSGYVDPNILVVGSPVALGAGVYHSGPAASAEVLNTIIANNSSLYQTNNSNLTLSNDVFGAFTSLSHNFIGITNRSTGFAAPNDLVGSEIAPLNPILGPLANNGGSTFTCALLDGSPAIDAGDDSLMGFDQRGYIRPSGAHVDIGAFEVQTPSGAPTLSPLGGTFRFRFTNTPGAVFAVLASTNVALPTTNWTTIGTAAENPPGEFQFTEATTNGSLRFYRVRSP